MIVRIVAILLAIPLLGLAALGLATQFAPDAVGGPLETLTDLLAGFGLGDSRALVTQATAPVARYAALGLGAFFLLVGVKPRRGGGEGEEATAGRDRGHGDLPPVDKRVARKAEKQAAALARKGQLDEAGDLCFHTGLLDKAAEYFEKAEEFVRAAEIRHDQNRFDESAELYIRAGRYETAGTIFASQSGYARAAECYHKAGRMSVAGEMYEKAGDFAKAGECFVHCDFHRHAAQAFLRAQDWKRAARALEAVVQEEGARSVGQDPGKARELRKLVLQAGKLYEQAGDAVSALRVLEKGECYGAAAQVAMRLEEFARAADLFQRSGDAPHAAEALRRVGEDAAAAQILGEHLREQGDDVEAARLLAEAGDFLSAGDLYRKMEDFLHAGECYERQTDYAQAAEMFRLAGEADRAAGCHERVGQLEEAAECCAELGDHAREAAYLARAGLALRAGQTYLREGLDDEAIKTLQQVKPGESEFAEASALLGEVFRGKGKHTLAVKKLRQAIGSSDLDPDNMPLFYSLATAHEEAGEFADAVDLYEKILAFDYHYKDVDQRLEAARKRVPESPISGTSSGLETIPQDTLTPPSSRPGRYRIEAELGRGGMGIVYRAHDTVLDRPVAFKVLPDALRDNPQALKNFLREAKSAAKLNHPNIVTVYDAGEQDGRFYIAMEFVDGTTLKEIVRRRGVISAAGVFHVTLQMCEALEYAHAQKVIHRDVKTANTMWTREKKAKIMDFGLAKVVEEVRNHTTLVSGTPYYMSPEQTLGKNVDHRTDLYSLGVTLFELATGALPFKEGNVPYHHVHTPAPDPREVNPKVPAPLATIVNRCLQKDPAARYQTAGEIVAEVRARMARMGGKPA